VNTTRGGEWSPYVSPDGRYFFFMSSRPIRPEDFPDKLTYEYLVRAIADDAQIPRELRGLHPGAAGFSLPAVALCEVPPERPLRRQP
jgi:hypothetical protein